MKRTKSMGLQVASGALMPARLASVAVLSVCLAGPTFPKQPPIRLEATTLNPIEYALSASARTSYSSIIQSWLPAAAAIGVIFTLLTYLLTNKKERNLRLEDRTAENIGVLIDFGGNQSITIGKAYNAFLNLHALGKTAGKSYYMSLSKRVADAIAQIVSFDLDLDDGRHVRFDALALDLWDGYRSYLSDRPTIHEGVLYRYESALRNLRISDPQRFSTVQRDSRGKYIFSQPIPDSKLQHFDTLVMNYQRHVELIKNPSRQHKYIQKCQEALQNAGLTEQLFSHLIHTVPVTKS
jgi:hypothetical protein